MVGLLLFEINCFYFDKHIRISKEYWQKIIDIKHPSMKDKFAEIQKTIAEPDEIRKSKTAEDIFLYYRFFEDKYICAVLKFLNGDGFIVTAYHTSKIKEGDAIWKK